eukprot:SAG31_NODE_3717_length_3952_cov_8.633424_2_plen_206_part_00
MFPVEQSHLRAAPKNLQLLVADEGITLHSNAATPAVECIRWEQVNSWAVVDKQSLGADADQLHLKITRREDRTAEKKRSIFVNNARVPRRKLIQVTIVLSTPNALKVADCLTERATAVALERKAAMKDGGEPLPPPPTGFVGEELAGETDGDFTGGVLLENPLVPGNGRAKKAGVAKTAKTYGREGADSKTDPNYIPIISQLHPN